jgi:hypothetical protein
MFFVFCCPCVRACMPVHTDTHNVEVIGNFDKRVWTRVENGRSEGSRDSENLHNYATSHLLPPRSLFLRFNKRYNNS